MTTDTSPGPAVPPPPSPPSPLDRLRGGAARARATGWRLASRAMWWGKLALFGTSTALLLLLVSPWGDWPVNWWQAHFGHRPLLGVNHWHYQLDRIEPSLPMLARNTADMLVIDHAKRNGKVALTKEEVEQLKVRPDGSRRLVVSYMAIGEAEEFRFYWKPEWKTAPPDWLGEENCAWPQAHRVRFWLDSWKDISFRGPNAFLKRIIDAGFDGVYLDRVDIYETFEAERPSARTEMVRFVAELSATAKAQRPHFLIIAQNGEDMLTDRAYRVAIDAIAKESLLYSASAGTGVRNKPEDIAWSKGRLDLLLGDRKPVFNVEYLTRIEDIDRVRHELFKGGFVPTFPTRSLDGEEPTLPRDINNEVGTPERTQAMCKPGTAW